MNEGWVPLRDWLRENARVTEQIFCEWRRQVAYIETRRTVEVIARKPRARRGRRRKS